MTVPLNDFRAQWKAVGAEVLAAVDRVGASGWYILGREVERFESALASVSGLPHAVGVGSGLDAIEIGLRCLGIRQGDKVLTTPLSAFATTLSVMRCGGVRCSWTRMRRAYSTSIGAGSFCRVIGGSASWFLCTFMGTASISMGSRPSGKSST